MADAHDLIVRIKELAIELGRTPTRDEFQKVLRSRKAVEDAFGTHAALVQAAGLEPPRAPRIDNRIFEKDLSQVLEKTQPRASCEPIRYAPTLCIGDTHFPFVNQKVLEAIYRFAEIQKPMRIIQVGDLFDLYAHSKFPRSQNIYSPRQEEELAVKGAREMWAELKRLCPEAECVQIKGNHDVRPVKRTLESVPSLEHVVEKHLNAIMTFDGVRLIEDHREEYVFDDVIVHHGYRLRLGEHRDYQLTNAIVGHTHKGGVVFRRVQGKTLWELNAGFTGDIESKVFSYTSQRMTNETTGFGFVDEYGPRFIPVG
jgi:predicted phosphodiesterase